MGKIYTRIIIVFLCFLTNGGWQLAAQLVSFGFTGSVQTYLVPRDVTRLAIDIEGASGGVTQLSRGGAGGRVQCTLAVTAGTVLYIYVGGEGPKSTNMGVGGGYNGGGCGSEDAGGGGGASDIRMGGKALANRVIVAGGGGGACGVTYVVSRDYDRGGDGGGLTAENGYRNGGNAIKDNAVAGNGGGPVSTHSSDIRCGAVGKGGNGYANYTGGGGGGGGYNGGAGGDESGGGGGSSYTDPVFVTSVVHTTGYRRGRGKITITPVAIMKQRSPADNDMQQGGEKK